MKPRREFPYALLWFLVWLGIVLGAVVFAQLILIGATDAVQR
jgi:hypothetical protein